MAIYLIIAFWVLVALTVFLVALLGGPRQARQSLAQGSGRGRQRFAIFALALTYLGFVVAIPVAVIVDNGGKGEQAAGGGGEAAQLSAGAEAGKQLFVETCGGCHTLAAAGTTGKIGPVLDEIKPDKARVLKAIKIGGVGSGRMPPGLLKGKQAQDVADFVASTAGKK